MIHKNEEITIKSKLFRLDFKFYTPDEYYF